MNGYTATSSNGQTMTRKKTKNVYTFAWMVIQVTPGCKVGYAGMPEHGLIPAGAIRAGGFSKTRENAEKAGRTYMRVPEQFDAGDRASVGEWRLEVVPTTPVS